MDENKQTSTKKPWMKHIIIALHTYAYSLWKCRNDVLHKKSTKESRKSKREKLQQRVADLYDRGRANLTPKELNYFKVPVAIRQKKGLESMALWIQLVEAIFKRRGQARQELMDSWRTGSTPTQSWRDRLKTNTLEANSNTNGQGHDHEIG